MTQARRRFRFSLRTVLLLMAILAAACGWFAQQFAAARQRSSVLQWMEATAPPPVMGKIEKDYWMIHETEPVGCGGAFLAKNIFRPASSRRRMLRRRNSNA